MRAALRLVLALLLLSAASRASAQGDRKRELMEGTHVLRRILYDHDFKALESYEDLGQEPEKTLLVVLGEMSALSKVPGGLEAFVRRGGAVLLASDRAVAGEPARELRAVAGVSINNERYVNNAECYKGANYCPRLRPVPRGGLRLLGEAGLDGRGELNVYTNVPSRLWWLGGFPGTVRPQATLPPGSMRELPGGRLWWDEPFPLFAVGGDLGDGRVLVLADHSVFINQMMLPTDTNNVEFSYNVVRWLQGEGGEGGQRTRVLFVEDGKVQTELEIPLRGVAISPEAMLKLLFARRNQILVEAENVITRLEDDNAFNNRLVESLERSGRSPEGFLMLLVVLGTLVGMLYLIYRLGVRARFRYDTSVPPLATELGRVLPATPLAEQRRQALLRIGDLREPAATMARRWFARLGLDVAGPEPEPAFEAAGGWWARRRLVARLRWLWRLACGRAASRVSPAELWRLQRDLDGLSAAHQRGAWRTTTPVPLSPASGERG